MNCKMISPKLLNIRVFVLWYQKKLTQLEKCLNTIKKNVRNFLSHKQQEGKELFIILSHFYNSNEF